jgi:nucleobase:cation symporter-1, NCS1 family
MASTTSTDVWHPDGRVELRNLDEIKQSPYYNEDLAPVPIAKRNWSTYNYVALWIGMAHCIPTYMMAAGLIAIGMNWWQSIFTIALGNLIVLIPMLLNSHAGTKYGIPFPIFVRSSFGVLGSNVAALLRAGVACGWFGIQTWIGGGALYVVMGAAFGDAWLKMGGQIAGIYVSQWIAFLVFWALNLYIIESGGMAAVRRFENWAAPFVLVMAVLLFVWMLIQAQGLGPILAEPGKLNSFGAFFPVFMPSLMGMIGFWATLSLNMPDFTRFGASQRVQIVGQISALPTTMTFFSAIGILITSATIIVYKEPIWDPVVLVGKFTNPVVVIIALVTLAVATLSVNIAANVVSPSNDFSNAFPKLISFKTGGYITGVLGILIQPWRLLSDPSIYIFSWLSLYSGALGAIAGVMAVDYWLIRKTRLSLTDLYVAESRYGKWNWRAIIALAIGMLFAIGGYYDAAAGQPDGLIPFLKPLYDYSWFIGFFLSGVVYYVLMQGVKQTEEQRAPQPV